MLCREGGSLAKKKKGGGHLVCMCVRVRVVRLVSPAQTNNSFHRKLAASDIPSRKSIICGMNGVFAEIKG